MADEAEKCIVFRQGSNFCIKCELFSFTCATSSCVVLCNFWCLCVPRRKQMT